MSLVNSRCEGRIGYPFPTAVRSVMMIAVGVGIAPMIQTIRAILRDFGGTKTGDGEEDGSGGKEGDGRFKVGQPPMQVVLLYGVVRAHTFLHVYIHFCTTTVCIHQCICYSAVFVWKCFHTYIHVYTHKYIHW